MRMGLWSPQEDSKLRQCIVKYGPRCWKKVPEKAGLRRSGKSCRLRWINYLKPDLRLGKVSTDEIRSVGELHRVVGNRWSQIATYLPGRTDNQIKNFWHSRMNRQIQRKSNQLINGIVESKADNTHQELGAYSAGATVVLPGCIQDLLRNRSLELDFVLFKEGAMTPPHDISSSSRFQFELGNALSSLGKSTEVNDCYSSLSYTRPPEGLEQIVWRFLNPSSAPVSYPFQVATASDDISQGASDVTNLIRSETENFCMDRATEWPAMEITPFSVDSLENYEMRDLRSHGITYCFDEAANSETEMEVTGSYETFSSSSATLGGDLPCWAAQHYVDPCSTGHSLQGTEQTLLHNHGCGDTQEMLPLKRDHMYCWGQHQNCYSQALLSKKSGLMGDIGEEGGFLV